MGIHVDQLAVVATSACIPWKIRSLIRGLTLFHCALSALDVAAVVCRPLSKRLFGLRGVRAAYDTERRGNQLLEVEKSAARGAVATPTGPPTARSS